MGVRLFMADVVRVDAEHDASPAEAILFSYRDVIAYEHGPAVLHVAVFEALAPDGCYVIIDHSAAPELRRSRPRRCIASTSRSRSSR